ncbi:hypothetical protein PYCC9005_003059 [Savitreella phatthalungensis]
MLAQSLIAITIIYSGSLAGLWQVRFLPANDLRHLLPYFIARSASQASKLICLRAVDAAFYQVARGLLLPFTVILSFFLLRNWAISRLAFGGCIIVIFGFAIGLRGELLANTTKAGLPMGSLSALATAAETVSLKRCLDDKGPKLLDIALTASCFNVPFAALLAWVTGDNEMLVRYVYSDAQRLSIQRLIGIFTISGLFSCILSLATLLQISVTSPVTHMVSTAFRGVLQSVIAICVFRTERLTSSRIVSLSVIISGTLAYSYGKELERSIAITESRNLQMRKNGNLQEQHRGAIFG